MAITKTYQGTEPVRINKWLAQSGVCSRREAEALIERGAVSIDGETVTSPGHKIAAGQTLTLAGAAQKALESRFTAVLNKPVDYVSAQPEGEQIPAARLLTAANRQGKGATPSTRKSLAPLGRLDADSCGLLLLSDDGVLAKAIIGPDSELEKEYVVEVKGRITAEKVERLCHGLELDGRKLKPAKVTKNGPNGLRFILKEGRKRQIRRMCELVGLEVVDLLRIRIGPLEMGSLPPGRWRPLSAEERAAMIRAAKPKPGPKPRLHPRRSPR
jgi:23S rRNA pseudouridine2604 synthase